MRRWRRWRELEDELRSHARMAAEDGRAPASLEAAQEATRDQWAWTWLDDFGRDLRYGARGLRRSPGFTLVAVLTFALGIGASSAMFSLVNGVLLRPLPYPQPARLVATTQYYPAGALVFLRGQSRTVAVAGYGDDRDFNLAGGPAPERATGSAVSADFFSVLGVAPRLGRTFARGEDLPGHDREVVLGEALWRQRFHADPQILGRAVEVDGVDREVVGVMPADFRFPSAQTRLWIPLHLDPGARSEYWAASYMQLIGRLRAGASFASGQAEWQALRPRLLAAYGWPMPPGSFRGATLWPLREMIVGDIGTRLWLLLGAVGLLLLIACVNVANLLLARAATRHREMGLRAALGAGRGRLLRQLVAEGLLLSGIGGGLGLALAAFSLPVLKSILPADLPRLSEVALDGRVLAFAVLIAAATGLGFGLLPARERGQRVRPRVRKAGALVVAEVALSAMLVVAAGLTARSLWKLAALNPGFRAAGVVTARLTPNPALCQPAERCVAFYGALLDHIRGLPGVENAAAVNGLPLGGVVEATTFQIESRPIPKGTRHPLALGEIVTPGYLDTMGIPLLRGRRFQSSDLAPQSAGVVIVSRAAAARLWPGKDALGEHLKGDGEPGWRTVVGIVGDVRESGTAPPPWLYNGIYSPYGSRAMLGCAPCGTPPVNLTLVVRTRPGASLGADALRAAVASAAPGVPISQVESLSDWVADSLAAPRSSWWLFSLAAGLAILLGAIGLYGVMAYEVAGRTREIGIRVALGARRGEVLRLVIGRAAGLVVAGIVAGLAGALLLARMMASLLYGVSASDPATYAAVAALWMAVALVASAIPARRAARVDPCVALRCE